MSYASVAQVQRLVASVTISSTSLVNTDSVQSMIDDTSSEIDAVLGGAGLQVPVATPSWFVSRLALLNAYGAAAMVLKSHYPEATGAGSDPAYAFWEQRYNQGLDNLRKGIDVPSDVPTDGGGSYGLLPSGLDGTENEPWFRKDMVF